MLPFYVSFAERFHDLHEQIQNYLNALPLEALDWKPGPEMNSISVIIVHLTGSERFLIGDVVMQEPSNRNRDSEFQMSGMSKPSLVKRLNDTEAYIKSAFEKLSLDDLGTERMHPRHGTMVRVDWALLHALEHTATHLGHINMTVQLWHQRNVGED